MDSDFPSEEQSDPESDYIIDPICGKDRSISYGLYKKMNLYQYHYNAVKVKYKRLAVTWFFAAFIGIGYILLGKEKALPFNDLIAISSLGLFASIGIFLLCFFDVNIYHRLGESIFAACANFESKNPSLGRAHINMAKLLVKRQISPVLFDGIFYCSLTFVLLLISDISLFFHLLKTNKTLAIFVFSIALIFIISLDVFLLKSSSKLVSAAEQELKKNSSL